MERMLAFDVETPNVLNDRICAIGVTAVENGRRGRSWYTLVDPACGFDRRNIQIHGIRPEDVLGAPTFPEVWARLRGLFHGRLLAAHNAAFDLGVLKKCLAHYGIREEPVRYVCTVRMARALLRETENHRLPTLCRWYGIPLDHHNAGSDSDACAEILCRLLAGGPCPGRFIREYGLTEPAAGCLR